MFAIVCAIIVISCGSCFLGIFLEQTCDSGMILLSFALGITVTALLLQNGII